VCYIVKLFTRFDYFDSIHSRIFRDHYGTYKTKNGRFDSYNGRFVRRKSPILTVFQELDDHFGHKEIDNFARIRLGFLHYTSAIGRPSKIKCIIMAQSRAYNNDGINFAFRSAVNLPRTSEQLTTRKTIMFAVLGRAKSIFTTRGNAMISVMYNTRCTMYRARHLFRSTRKVYFPLPRRSSIIHYNP